MTFVQFSIKEFFFDREVVAKSLDKVTRQALSKAGAFVRTRARQSIRRSKKSSAPGEPPRAHSKAHLNLKTILFGYDQLTKTVVVGPVKLNQREFAMRSNTTVPARLELGGFATLHQQRWRASEGSPASPWRRRDLRRKIDPRKEYRTVRTHYRARPFMRPALAHEAPKFPDLFSNAVRA